MNGVQRGDWNRYVTVLMSAGLAYADAVLWERARHWDDDPPELLVMVLGTYLDHGFTPVEGYYWGLHEIRASEAVDWANHGWLPSQVERLYDYLLTVGPKGTRGTRESP